MNNAEHERAYRLDELAERAGISARTVRYYVQRGLLPAPVFRGRDTAYDEGHLLRLRAIKRLQEQHLPLDEIAAALAGEKGGEAARAVLEGKSAASKRARAVAPKHDERAVEERGARCVRWSLAPGVELFVADGVDEDGKALVAALQALARRHRAGGSER